MSLLIVTTCCASRHCLTDVARSYEEDARAERDTDMLSRLCQRYARRELRLCAMSHVIAELRDTLLARHMRLPQRCFVEDVTMMLVATAMTVTRYAAPMMLLRTMMSRTGERVKSG